MIPSGGGGLDATAASHKGGGKEEIGGANETREKSVRGESAIKKG